MPTTPLHPSQVYHVYNHGNAEDNLFRTEENYRYFLQKYVEYISPIADTHAYCLMPNHFHFLVRMKREEELVAYFQSKRRLKDLAVFENGDASVLPGLISKQFSNFFNAYSKAFNKQYNRRGSLFEEVFKRKPVTSSAYYSTLMRYIHQNPVHHGFTESPEDWAFRSYQVYVQQKKNILKKESVIGWFGGVQAFERCHHKGVSREIVNEIGY